MNKYFRHLMLVCVLTLFLGLLPSFAQSEYRNQRQIWNIIKDMKKQMGILEILDARSMRVLSYGTGFFLEYDNQKYFITAAHIAYNTLKRKKIKHFKYRCRYQNRAVKLDHLYITKATNKIDIWILKSSNPTEEVLAFSFSERLRNKMLIAGKEILFCGFPLNFKQDEILCYSYMARKGMISGRFPVDTKRNDFRKIYIIDGFCSSGDSGAPVIDLPNEELIGFVQGYKHHEGSKAVSIGLGMVIPIKYVIEVIEQNIKPQALK